MQDRIESADDVSSGAGSKVITFGNAIKATPAIGISATMETGDYYEITSKAHLGLQ